MSSDSESNGSMSDDEIELESETVKSAVRTSAKELSNSMGPIPEDLIECVLDTAISTDLESYSVTEAYKEVKNETSFENSSNVFRGVEADFDRSGKVTQSWIKKKNKLLKDQGKAYMAYKKVNGKWELVERPAVIMSAPCNSSKCKKSALFSCKNFTHQDRMAIFESFWKMDGRQKSIYVCELVRCTETRRQTKRRRITNKTQRNTANKTQRNTTNKIKLSNTNQTQVNTTNHAQQNTTNQKHINAVNQSQVNTTNLIQLNTANQTKLKTTNETEVNEAESDTTKQTDTLITNDVKSRRMITLFYHLKDDNGIEKRVCKKMFLSTLGLREGRVLSWLRDMRDNHGAFSLKKAKPRGKNGGKGRVTDKDRDHLYSFLKDLPKLPGFYSRPHVNKLYLEPQFKTKVDVHSLYKISCEEKERKCLSMRLFDQYLDTLNIAIYKPKKDVCDVCAAYEKKNISEEDWLRHQSLKDKAIKRKKLDEESASDMMGIYSVEQQPLIQLPRTQSGMSCQKSKLNIHNFTIYDLKSKDAYCFLWNETQGNLGANECTSVLIEFLRAEIEKGLSVIIIWSDGCAFQNKNSVLSNALLLLSNETGVVIYQKYLVAGHAQTECDFIHLAIDKKLRNQDLFTLFELVCQIEDLRPHQRYKCKILDFSFFLNFELPLKFDLFNQETGGEIIEPQNIKSLIYFDGKIGYVLDFDDDWLILSQHSFLVRIADLPKAYSQPLPLHPLKKKHLSELLPS
ncbi:uncharacterized protein LOC136025334 [Artemia franciscana]|uniref:DUF7869 domain-containing protein n=1 Tax=Artemia franciscana TaxID=6661 RepID=A0AA88HN64_ARTSF|nr:hypothetical protein QYM36_011310 [Artemia franciscana]